MQGKARRRVRVTFLVPFSLRHLMKVTVKHSAAAAGGLPAGGRDDDDQEDDGHNHPDDRHHLHVLPPVLPLEPCCLKKMSKITQFVWTSSQT